MDVLNVLTEVAGLHQLAISPSPLESALVDRRVAVLVDYRDVREQRRVLLHRVLVARWLALSTESGQA